MHKKILSGLMALAMVAPAFANVISAGGTGSVPVELNAAATSFSVTVPTGLPVDVAADGAITVSDKNYIVNNSFGPVEVKGAKIETANGWTLKDFGSRFETLKVNAQEFGFQLNECNVGTDGSVEVTNFKPIDGGAKQAFTYDAKVAPQAEELGKQQIASVVFTLGWSGETASVGPVNPPHARGTVMSKAKLDAQAQYKTGTLTISREKHNPATHGAGVDVSAAGDGSVMCVVSGEDVTVYGEGGVKPEDCVTSSMSDSSGNDSLGTFSGYRASIIDVSGLDTSEMTDMGCMFDSSLASEIKGLENFDLSNIWSMCEMFNNAHVMKFDLSHWDTSKVKHMEGIFADCHATTLDLSSFDVSSVQNTNNMFLSSPATKIYCRTEKDMQKMQSSRYCNPSSEAFTVGKPQ